MREKINYEEKLSLKMFIHSAKLVHSHWHNSLEVIFVLEGQVNVILNGELMMLEEEDIIVIPPNTIHSISSDTNNSLLALQISSVFITNNGGDLSRFSLLNENDKQNFPRIRTLMAQMMMLYSKFSDTYELSLNALMLELLYLITKNHQNTITSKETQWQIQRIKRMLTFINENYRDDISLNDIKELEYLSLSYVSKFFNRYIGANFTKYLTSVRLESAMHELVHSDKMITNIGLDNGFPNQKAFFKSFKDAYGETPKTFRKQIASSQTNFNKKLNYFLIEDEASFAILAKFLSSSNPSNNLMHKVLHDNNIIDTKIVSKNLKHTWRNLTTVAKASDLLRADVRDQLQDLQKRVGFKYIRFHGIFDDSMMVYTEDKKGNPIYNFTYVDRIFDFLQSIGLKPFVELGFMPTNLAKFPKQTLFYSPICTSVPKCMNKWKDLVSAFVAHCNDRYNSVADWYFEVWNEPNFKNIFWHGEDDEYFELFKETVNAVKSVSPKFMVGGPSIYIFPNVEDIFLKKMLHYCEKNKCVFDFISFHVYSGEVNFAEVGIKSLDSILDTRSKSFPISSNENFLKETIKTVIDQTGNLYPLHITEFNADPWARNLCHDTCYTAAFIVKNLLETMDSVKSLAYWTLSDFMEEYQIGKGPFFGNFGLYSIHGMPKPIVLAMELLSKLGDELISSGDGYFVTKSSKGIQIMLYNYCHFDKLFSSRDMSAITMTDRYNVFNDKELTIGLILINLTNRKYRQTTHSLNRNYGSAYDVWVNELAATEYPTTNEIEYLIKRSEPNIMVKTIECNGEISISKTLLPHEVVLVTLE